MLPLDADIYFGQSIQPYFGLGYGYAVPYTPVTFVMDLGVLYGEGHSSLARMLMGILMCYSSRTIQDQEDSNHTKFIPVLSLGIAIRIL